MITIKLEWIITIIANVFHKIIERNIIIKITYHNEGYYREIKISTRIEFRHQNIYSRSHFRCKTRSNNVVYHRLWKHVYQTATS